MSITISLGLALSMRIPKASAHEEMRPKRSSLGSGHERDPLGNTSLHKAPERSVLEQVDQLQREFKASLFAASRHQEMLTSKELVKPRPFEDLAQKCSSTSQAWRKCSKDYFKAYFRELLGKELASFPLEGQRAACSASSIASEHARFQSSAEKQAAYEACITSFAQQQFLELMGYCSPEQVLSFYAALDSTSQSDPKLALGAIKQCSPEQMPFLIEKIPQKLLLDHFGLIEEAFSRCDCNKRVLLYLKLPLHFRGREIQEYFRISVGEFEVETSTR